MIKTFLRHWVLIDLAVFRNWLTDTRIQYAELIDNRDGTFGRAFDLHALPPEALIAVSETIAVALERGTDAVEALSTGKPRVLRPSPNLQDLVAKHGGYDRIPPAAWAAFERDTARWLEDVRLGQAEVQPDLFEPIKRKAMP